MTTNNKNLMPLLEILNMAKDPSRMKLNLFEVICEWFPASEKDGTGLGNPNWPQYLKVRFSCPHNDHSVSGLGFLILEEVEVACGSSPNLMIDICDLSYLREPMLSALSRRASCQEDPLKEFKVNGPGFCGGAICCKNTWQAEALLTIAKCSQTTSFEGEIFVGDVKQEGWAALGKVAELHEIETDRRTVPLEDRPPGGLSWEGCPPGELSLEGCPGGGAAARRIVPWRPWRTVLVEDCPGRGLSW